MFLPKKVHVILIQALTLEISLNICYTKYIYCDNTFKLPFYKICRIRSTPPIKSRVNYVTIINLYNEKNVLILAAEEDWRNNLLGLLEK